MGWDLRHVTAQSQEQLLSFLVAIPEQRKFKNPYGKGEILYAFHPYEIMGYIDKTMGERKCI